jgi:hypothetical protein
VEFNSGIRPRNKPEYLWFRQVFTTLGFALRKLESPGPALESAAPDRERAETARPRRRRSVAVGFSGGLGALTARFRTKAAVDRGFFGGRPEPVFEAPGKRGFRCGRPDRDALRKQAASGVSAPEHRPDRPEIRHAPRNTAERGSARSAVRQALQTPRGVPRGSESARRAGPRLIPA